MLQENLVAGFRDAEAADEAVVKYNWRIALTSSRCEYSYGRLPLMVPALCNMEPFSVVLNRWPGGTCDGNTLAEPAPGGLKYCDRGNEYAHECGGIGCASPLVVYDELP